MSGIEPCPFCGGTKLLVNPILNRVVCKGCGADHSIDLWNTRSQSERERRLEEALKPFVDVRDQCPETVKLILPKLDGLTPITVTVTKAQFLAARSALNPTPEGGSDAG